MGLHKLFLVILLMGTIKSIIKYAYREGGLIQIGSDPSSVQLAEGLYALEAVISSMYGNEIGEPFVDVFYGVPEDANSFAKDLDIQNEIDRLYVLPNVRLNTHLSSSKTIYLNPSPNDGERFGVIDLGGNFSVYNLRLNGNGHKIEEAASKVLLEDGLIKSWIFRADLGQWSLVEGLNENSNSPFPPEFDNLLSIKLAMRLNPRYLVTADPQTIDEYRRLLKIFKARYKQKRETPVEEALLRTNSNKNFSLFANYSSKHHLFNSGLLR